jgi:hypothetical protein
MLHRQLRLVQLGSADTLISECARDRMVGGDPFSKYCNCRLGLCSGRMLTLKDSKRSLRDLFGGMCIQFLCACLRQLVAPHL